MFDWFKGKDNVYKFPEMVTPPIPEIPLPKSVPTTVYSIGPTSDNRITFAVGHSTLTMNKVGCQQLVSMLNTAMDQLNDDDSD
jgi:hypothetical protein